MLARLLRRLPSRKWLDGIIDRLLMLADDNDLESKPCVVAPKDFTRLCTAVREALLKEASLVELPAGFEGDTIVVGDLHGQFFDLQRILAASELPPTTRWVFLGDYVDRGFCGLEILSLLFALKLRHPENIVLLRGNHECTEITLMFGFCGECQRRANFAAWEAAMQVFDALPFAALVAGRVLCVHGGISPQLRRLSQITALPRPVELEANASGLLADLLWADPSPNVSGFAPNPRGVSYVFGLDAARTFLAAAGLRALVRAHMVQAEGYQVLGDSEVLTVFSASNYRDSGNPGAVLHISPVGEFRLQTFPPLERRRPPAQTAAAALADLPPPPDTPDALQAEAATRGGGAGAAAGVVELHRQRSAELLAKLDALDSQAMLQEVALHGHRRSPSGFRSGSELGH